MKFFLMFILFITLTSLSAADGLTEIASLGPDIQGVYTITHCASGDMPVPSLTNEMFSTFNLVALRVGPDFLHLEDKRFPIDRVYQTENKAYIVSFRSSREIVTLGHVLAIEGTPFVMLVITDDKWTAYAAY